MVDILGKNLMCCVCELTQVNGYEVFDSYVEDVERQRIAKEKAAAATAKKPAAKDEKDEHEEGETKEVAKEAVNQSDFLASLRRCCVMLLLTCSGPLLYFRMWCIQQR